MKISVNNRQVAHLFANASQPEARGSNFRFDREEIRIGRKSKSFLVLYSYQTPIAFQEYDPQRPAHGPLYITTRNYSISTSQHVSSLGSAASHRQRIYVDGVSRGSYAFHFIQGTFDRTQTKKRLIAEFKATAKEVSKLDKRQKPKAAFTFESRVSAQAELFHTIHGKNLPYVFPASLQPWSDKYEETQATRNAGRTEREAKKNAERNARHAAELAEKLPQWLAGEPIYLPPHTAAYLRLKNAETVETSHGAQVPLNLALAFYRRLLAGEARPGQHVGSFTVTACTGDPIIIGCHTIMRSEMARLYATVPADTYSFPRPKDADQDNATESERNDFARP